MSKSYLVIRYFIGKVEHKLFIYESNVIAIKVTSHFDNRQDESWYDTEGKYLNCYRHANKTVTIFGSTNLIIKFWCDPDGRWSRATYSKEPIDIANNGWSIIGVVSRHKSEISPRDIVALNKINYLNALDRHKFPLINRAVLSHIGLVLPTNSFRRRPNQVELEIQIGRLFGTSHVMPLSAGNFMQHSENAGEKMQPITCVRVGPASVETVSGLIPTDAAKNVNGIVVLFGWNGEMLIPPQNVWKIMNVSREKNYTTIYSIRPYVVDPPVYEELQSSSELELPKGVLYSYPCGTPLMAVALSNIRHILPGMAGGLVVNKDGGYELYVPQ